MSLGLVITAAAVAWLGTTGGVAALFASAVPLGRREQTPADAPSRRAPAVPVRPAPALSGAGRPSTPEEHRSRER